MPKADFSPERRFFVDLIIRDITLEDAILDLIDNAIDSLVQMTGVDIYKDFITTDTRAAAGSLDFWVKVDFTSKQFTIEDNCGGIPFERARDDVFRFGHLDPRRGPSLSVFGIGMKRAIFKIGREIRIESHAKDSGFLVNLDVDHWLDKTKETEWKIPIEKQSGHADDSKPGTKIKFGTISLRYPNLKIPMLCP